jgi:hypothetical protein
MTIFHENSYERHVTKCHLTFVIFFKYSAVNNIKMDVMSPKVRGMLPLINIVRRNLV